MKWISFIDKNSNYFKIFSAAKSYWLDVNNCIGSVDIEYASNLEDLLKGNTTKINKNLKGRTFTSFYLPLNYLFLRIKSINNNKLIN